MAVEDEEGSFRYPQLETGFPDGFEVEDKAEQHGVAGELDGAAQDPGLPGLYTRWALRSSGSRSQPNRAPFSTYSRIFASITARSPRGSATRSRVPGTGTFASARW